jgi:hypothetical protein
MPDWQAAALCKLAHTATVCKGSRGHNDARNAGNGLRKAAGSSLRLEIL